MESKFEILREDKDSALLVVTPLAPGHKISRETRNTIQRNDIPFTWISSEGPYNVPTNVENGIFWYRRKGRYPVLPYVLPLDKDISLGRYMIDRLYARLDSSDDNIAFAYASFAFKGYINQKFPAYEYDINMLVKGNYISSNSLIKIRALEDVEWFVKDDDMVRLLDWSQWLKFYRYNWYGIPCPEANFVVNSSPSDISSRSEEDYKIKSKRVFEKFVLPLFEKKL